MEELARWRIALTEENPLLDYFRLAESRRLAAIPGWRRRLAIYATLLAGAALMLYIVLVEADLPPPEAWPWIALVLIGLPTLAVWLLQSLYRTALCALEFLGSAGRRVQLQMDDMSSLSLLSDHQLAAGALRAMLPVLAWPVLACALAYWLLLLGFSTDMGGEPYSEHASTVLLLGPLTIFTIGISGLLAAATLVLWWLGLGRGLRGSLLAMGALAWLAVAQLAWLVLSAVIIVEGGLTFFNDADVFDQMDAVDRWLLLLLTAPVAGAFVVYTNRGALALAHSALSFRALLVIGGPLIVPALLAGFVATLLGFYGYSWWLDPVRELAELVFYHVLFLLGGTQLLNPAAVPSPACISAAELPFQDADRLSLISPGEYSLLLLTQLALLWAAGRNAVHSISRRRRNVVE